jgi:hypothetical protein
MTHPFSMNGTDASAREALHEEQSRAPPGGGAKRLSRKEGKQREANP